MKKYIKKIVRFISVKPIIGKPVRMLVAIIRLPQMRDMIFGINQQINELNSQINEIAGQINEVKDRQHELDIEHMSRLIEIFEYQANLKKSLPVVLRQYRRAIIKQNNQC